MLTRLFLLFVIVPLVELAILIRLGELLGLWPTIALVIATGVAGAALAKSQGAKVIREIQADLGTGRAPAGRLVDGLLILVGGVVLLTPGLLTDIAGLLLLLPFTRSRLKARLGRRFARMAAAGDVRMITLIR